MLRNVLKKRLLTIVRLFDVIDVIGDEKETDKRKGNMRLEKERKKDRWKFLDFSGFVKAYEFDSTFQRYLNTYVYIVFLRVTALEIYFCLEGSPVCLMLST